MGRRVQPPDRGWIGWILIHIDNPRDGIARKAKHLLKEAFRGSRIAFGGEQEINGLPGGVHGSVEILLLALHPYLSFNDTVALVRALEIRLAALVQLRRVRLDPAPYATGIHRESPFR